MNSQASEQKVEGIQSDTLDSGHKSKRSFLCGYICTRNDAAANYDDVAGCKTIGSF